jgi:hypothetical protein
MSIQSEATIAAIEPMERSISPIISISVIPTAATRRGAEFVSSDRIFWRDRNSGVNDA